MPNALFFNVPAHGHVNPSLPLVAELVRRGHSITYFITQRYRAAVEAAGAVVQPYAAVHDDYFASRGLDGTRPWRAAYELITTSGVILPELLAFARDAQPDYILFDGMCPWGQLTAQILGLPAVASLSLMPPGSPRSMLNLSTLRMVLPVVLRDIDKGVLATLRSRALGKTYAVPPLGPLAILNSLGDLAISSTSAYFHPSAETVPASVRLVGRMMSETAAGDSVPLAQAHGRRVVYVSLGSLVTAHPTFFRTCIDAFAGSDWFVVISTGGRFSPDAFGALPDNIAVHAWVPQLAVLKRAALFISHGGFGSVHDGLYFGLPLLLVPQQEEQAMTARRVVELGAGLLLTPGEVNVERLRATAARLLADTRFKVEA